jgi:peptidylprolyl isomerase
MIQDIAAQRRADEERKKAEFVEWLAGVKTKATKTSSGLMYYDKAPGDGPSPEPSNMVRVHYTAWLSDGTVLEDTRKKESEEVWVDRKDLGWKEGVSTMRVGGRRILIVPPELGYGDQGTSKIPPNSTLVYDIELYEIIQ